MLQLLLASTGKGLRAVGAVRWSYSVCQVRRIPSLHGASLESKLSMALLSSSTNGSESNSAMVGRHSMASRAAEHEKQHKNDANEI